MPVLQTAKNPVQCPGRWRPSNKCRLNTVDCTVSKRREQKKHTRTNLKRSDQENGSLCSLATIMALVHGKVNPIDIMTPGFAGWSDIESSKYQDQNADNDVYHESLQRLPHRPNLERDPAGVDVQQMPAYVQSTLTYGITTTYDSGLRSPRLVTPILNCPLPAYVKPLPDGIAEDDMRYLWRKGALSIPERRFRNELLRCYIEFVHPCMPLIEQHDFLRIINKNGGETVSLLLFQAVMFAGSAFVDMTYLYAAGFTSRKAARKAFYQRTKLLYDFDYEADPLVLVQSLLLMTYWYETPDDKKGPWHWLCIAISLAYEIRLHKNQDSSNVSFKEQGLRKRIWWSCVMRDCQLALGTRRRAKINRADFDVSMLTLDDFRIECLASNNLSITSKCTVARDRQMQRDLAVLCIAQVKLCLCISHLWVPPCPVLSHAAQDHQANREPNSMAFLENLEMNDVKDFDIELMQWAKDLPTPCRYQAPSAADVEDGRSSVFLSQALLHMLYLSAVLALNRPRVSASAEAARNQENCSGLQDHSHRKVREASYEISRISMDLINLNLERYLPPQGVTVLLHAISGHLFDAKSVSDVARQKALRGFSQCIHVLKSLRDNYPAADYACRFLDVAKRKMGADFKVISEVGDGGENLLRDVRFQSQGINDAELFADRHSRSSPLSHEAPPHEDAYTLMQRTTDTQADTVEASKYRSIFFNGNLDAILNVDTEVNGGSWESRPSMTLTDGMLGESGGILLEIDWMRNGV